MAITITQQPTSPNAAYTRLVYVISGSSNTTAPQFEYVMDVYESGSTNLISRVTQTVNPAGVAVFDPSRIIQGQLSYPKYFKEAITSSSLSDNKVFEIKFGEQYGTSISSSITVYPNATSSSLSVVPTVVDPTAGTYNLQQAYPRLLETGSIDNPQLSDNPYCFNRSPYNPYPLPEGKNSLIPLSSTDYFTVSYLDTDSDAGTNIISISIVDDSFQTIFTGRLVDSSNAYYTGSLPQDLVHVGIGPANLRDVPMDNLFTGSLGNQTFGQVIDSGSWSYIQVLVSLPEITGIVDNQFIANESKINSVYSFGNANPNTPYYVNGNEKLRFAFINKYGVWDYWTNYNPVRRSSDIQRENVTLPRVDYSSTLSPYDITRRGEKSYYVEHKDRFVVDTPLLDQPFANWLEQLLESPSVFIQRGDDFVPVVITNNSYRHNNDTSRNKLFKYTIEFEPSNQPFGEWVPEYADIICPTPTPSPTPSPTPTSTPTPSSTPTATPTPTPTSTPTATPTPSPSPTPILPFLFTLETSSSIESRANVLDAQLGFNTGSGVIEVASYTDDSISVFAPLTKVSGSSLTGTAIEPITITGSISLEVSSSFTASLYTGSTLYSSIQAEWPTVTEFSSSLSSGRSNYTLKYNIDSKYPFINYNKTVSGSCFAFTPLSVPSAIQKAHSSNTYLELGDYLYTTGSSYNKYSNGTYHYGDYSGSVLIEKTVTFDQTLGVTNITSCSINFGPSSSLYGNHEFVGGTADPLDLDVMGIKPASGSSILVVGSFNNTDGNTDYRKFVIVNPDGTLDSNFSAYGWNSDTEVRDAVWIPATQTYAVASTGTYNDVLTVFDITGSVVTTGNTWSYINQLELADDGYVYVTGQRIASPTSYYVSRFDPTTWTEDTTWANNVRTNVGGITGAGSVIRPIKGTTELFLFSQKSSSPRTGQVNRVKSDGTLASVYSVTIQNGYVDDMVYSSGSFVYIIGQFDGARGVTNHNINKSTWDLQSNFGGWTAPSSAMGDMYRGLLQDDGKLIVMGDQIDSSGVAGSPIPVSGSVIRLNSDGTFDANFYYPTNDTGIIKAVHELNDGTILMGGQFEDNWRKNLYELSSVGSFVKLNQDGYRIS